MSEYEGLTFRGGSATVSNVKARMNGSVWFYAYFTPPVLSAGEVALPSVAA